MRIAWRSVLPVVPLVFLLSARHIEWQRERYVRGASLYHAGTGESFRGMYLWASRSAYEENLGREHARLVAPATSQEGEVGWPEELHSYYPLRVNLAFYLNLPAVLIGSIVSAFLLNRFDVPMMPTFYLTAALVSFLFWYAVGDWVERRRKRIG